MATRDFHGDVNVIAPAIFRVGGVALSFSHLAGVASLAQLPAMPFTSMTGVATLAQLPAIGFSNLTGKISAAQQDTVTGWSSWTNYPGATTNRTGGTAGSTLAFTQGALDALVADLKTAGIIS